MDQELKSFRDLVLTVWEHHENPWDYSNKDAQKIYELVNSHFRPLSSDNEVEEGLPSEQRVTGAFKTRYLYLNPVTHGTIMVPVLTLKADFGRSIPEVRFQLGLFLLHKGDVRWIGFRFEAPEGIDAAGAGRHHYYHVQMIRGLHTSIPFPSNEHLEWIPDKEPTFPLDADGPSKLLLCVLVSLYGVQEVLKLINLSPSRSQLRERFDAMHTPHFPVIEWYWKVTAGADAKGQFWKTANPDTWRAKILGQYAGCTIEGINKAAYDSAPATRRHSH
jgi:hypothetical protein